MTNHVDRFHAAVTVLAGNGRVKQRLMKAYEDHLADIEADELPDAVKLEFADLTSLMYRVAPLNGESAVCASVRKMSPKEAGQCACSVVALYRELLRITGDSPAALPLEQVRSGPTPPFLVKTS